MCWVFFFTLTQVFLILKLSELAKCCMKSLSCVFYEIYFQYIHACWAPSCFFEEPETSCMATVRKHCPGQAPSVLELSVCPEPKHGLTPPLMPCSHSQTFAASLLYFPWKGPCVNVGQARFSGTARRVSHVKTTWHYKEFAEEVVLVNESRDSVGKAPFMSQSYASVFF